MLSHDRRDGQTSFQMQDCPCCGSKEVREFFESHLVPVDSGAVFGTKEEAMAMPIGPMHLTLCRTCGYIWNRAFEPGLVSYGRSYDISMHHSSIYQAFLEKTVNRLIDTYNLRDRSIVEIACGSGQFLKLLCRLGGNKGFGIDPSAHSEGSEPCGAKTVTFIRDRYSEKYAQLEADMVCCRHVIEALPSPKDFLTMVRRILGSRLNTKIYFETQNSDYMYAGPIKWSFMYEFSVQLNPLSLSRLFAESGYRVLNAGPCYQDGQYAFIEAVPDDAPKSERPQRFVASEEFIKRVERYSDKVKESTHQWENTMTELRRTGKKVAGWGAGGRAGIFLSMFDPDRLIEYVVDINPLRQEKFMSVTGKRIVPPDFLRQYHPDVIIVMNPTYVNEIKGQVKEMGLRSEILSI